jgi:Flp pilus assembly secretin CpaC
MMIAGLLQGNLAPEHRRPARDDDGLPVLGALFRSRDYLTSGETELVVIVEPYIVHPDLARAGCRPRPTACASPAICPDQSVRPAEPGLRHPRSDRSFAGTGWQGPVGYVIE